MADDAVRRFAAPPQTALMSTPSPSTNASKSAASGLQSRQKKPKRKLGPTQTTAPPGEIVAPLSNEPRGPQASIHPVKQSVAESAPREPQSLPSFVSVAQRGDAGERKAEEDVVGKSAGRDLVFEQEGQEQARRAPGHLGLVCGCTLHGQPGRPCADPRAPRRLPVSMCHAGARVPITSSSTTARAVDALRVRLRGLTVLLLPRRHCRARERLGRRR